MTTTMIRKWSSSVARGPKIAVAMSGGVDSSVVAYLLRQEYPETELLGVHMSNWDYHTEDRTSSSGQNSTLPSKCWEQDWKDAKAVAQHVGLPIVHTSFEDDYWNSVFEPLCGSDFQTQDTQSRRRLQSIH